MGELSPILLGNGDTDGDSWIGIYLRWDRGVYGSVTKNGDRGSFTLDRGHGDTATKFIIDGYWAEILFSSPIG